jgi:hypothetical protein
VWATLLTEMPCRDGDGNDRELHDFIRADRNFDPELYLDEMETLDEMWLEQPTSNQDIAAQAEDPYSIPGSLSPADFQMLNLPVDALLQTLNDSIISRGNGGPERPGRGPEVVEHMPMSGPIFDDISPEDYDILLGQLDEHTIGDIFSGEVYEICDSDTDGDPKVAPDVGDSHTDEPMPGLLDHEAGGDEADGDEGDAKAFVDFMQSAQYASGPATKRRRIKTKSPLAMPERPMGMPSQNLKAAAASRGVSAASFKRLVLCGFPMVLLNALVLIQNFFPASDMCRTDASELYSGVEYVADAWDQAGLTASVFDVIRHPVFEDINSPEGMLTALRLIRNIREGGVAHLATVCSTWVYLCRATTGRSVTNPLGDRGEPLVENANTMVARTSLLLVFATALLVFFIHEQPLTSLMPDTMFFRWAKTMVRDMLSGTWQEVFTWLGAYGHETWKPTQLVSNAEWSACLYKKMTAEQRYMLKPDSGVRHLPCDPSTLRRRISGVDGLKSSQAYPKAYGLAVHREWTQRPHKLPTGIKFDEIDSDEEVPWSDWQARRSACAWKELKLQELQESFGVPDDYPMA